MSCPSKQACLCHSCLASMLDEGYYTMEAVSAERDELKTRLTRLIEAAEVHCATVVHHAPEHEDGIRNRLLDTRTKLRAAIAEAKR